MIHIFLIEIKLLLCDNLVILALGITHFTWIRGQHIVVNLLLIKPFWRTKKLKVVLYLNYLPEL